MYLVDTNVWLERLLGQEKSETVGQFLYFVPSDQLFISDFALHSIGVILCKLGNSAVYLNFIDDLFVNGSVTVLPLEAEDMSEVISAMEEFNLDFDDAYQYIAARKDDLIIVSFDKDFDKTQLGRKSPEDICIGEEPVNDSDENSGAVKSEND